MTWDDPEFLRVVKRANRTYGIVIVVGLVLLIALVGFLGYVENSLGA